MPDAPLTINIALSDHLQMPALHRWLGGIEGVHAELVPGHVQSGEQGGAWEAITVACGSGGAAIAAIQALKAWLESRRSTVTVRLRVNDHEIEVTATNIEHAAELVTKVLGDS